MIQGKKHQSSVQPQALYTPAGFCMVRTPALPVTTFLNMTALEAHGDDGKSSDLDQYLATARRQSYGKLDLLVSDPRIEQALWVASTDIFEGLARIQAEDVSLRRFERTYAGIGRYLTRMCTRPTPFGLFSGVAIGSLGTTTTMQLGQQAIQKMRTRPDMGWLLALIQKIEGDKNLLPQLYVLANRTVYIAGQRAILPYADVYGSKDNRSIAIRATTVVQFVLEQARESILYSTLRERTCEAFPRATERQVDGMLLQLWENHFLVSNLRPPLTHARPERYILENIKKIPDATKLAAQLQEVLNEIEEIDRQGFGGSRHLLSHLKETQKQLVSEKEYTQQTYQIDSALQVEMPQLHQDIGKAAAEAAEILMRLGRFPRGSQSLHEYYIAFVTRYGTDTEVALLDLLSPEFGLDVPPGYTEPPRSYALPTQPPLHSTQLRDGVLCAMLAQAINAGKMEVELTEPLIQQLAQWSPQDEQLPPSTVEVYLQIQASSRAAIDQGKWRGVVAPAGLTYGGRTFGRFFDILEPEGLEKLRNYAKREEALFPDTIFAELSYIPTTGRTANVVIRPALRSYEIVVNTPPSVAPDKVIALDDLVVGVRGNRFYIRSRHLQKEVIVTQSNMLNILLASNVCRFLLEVSQSRHPGLSPFDWGAASQAPFLPRVVWKQVVLRCAQWNVHAAMIVPEGTGSDEARWFKGLQKWRKQWHMPRYVYLTQADNRLLLDLEHPLSIAELRSALNKARENEAVQLQEMLPDFDHLWLRDRQNAAYIAELIVPVILHQAPLARAEETPEQQVRKPAYPQHTLAESDRRKLPGEEWSYLKLYAAQKQHDEIITKELYPIVHTLHQQGLIDRWFYIRYTDPEPHVRLRFHAANMHVQDALFMRSLSLCRELVKKGAVRNICIEPYVREVERYGGPEAIDEIEKVFTANSSALVSLVSALYQKHIQLDPIAVAVLSLDQFFQIWGLDFTERLHYIQRQTEQHKEREAFRPQRKLFTELLAPWDSAYNPELREQRERVCTILARQAPVVRDVAVHIHGLAVNGALWRPEEYILSSLAHMHLNRLLGSDRERENKIYAFWRHTLESIQKRPCRKEETTPVREKIL